MSMLLANQRVALHVDCMLAQEKQKFVNGILSFGVYPVFFHGGLEKCGLDACTGKAKVCKWYILSFGVSLVFFMEALESVFRRL